MFRNVHIALNGLYLLILVLFLLDSTALLEIKSQMVKSAVYFGFLVGTPFMLFWNAIAGKNGTEKRLQLILPLASLLIILGIGPLRILFSVGSWHTQTVLYRNVYSGSRTVEYQMKDVGALGYRDRTVTVRYLTPLFMITSPPPAEDDTMEEWIRTDTEINELGLKYP